MLYPKLGTPVLNQEIRSTQHRLRISRRDTTLELLRWTGRREVLQPKNWFYWLGHRGRH